jgi:Mg2+-importing ATPase
MKEQDKGANENKFWENDTSYWFKQLNSSDKGLSQQAADKVLSEEKNHSKSRPVFNEDILLFISQFKSPLMLLLIGAVIISAFLGDTSDVFIILFIVLSTGVLSFFQERNAGKVVEKLQSFISLKSSVLRDGVVKEIPSKEIVKGDVIILNAGDMLPADCLLIEANELQANESSLTGESYPVRKEPGVVDVNAALADRTNCLWEGTNIVSGNAKALVIQTGANTVFGSIAQSASAVNETAFEKGIKDFGFFLMKITLILAVFILVLTLLHHRSIIDSALFALALAVGMAPELLPAITTIAMSMGAKRLLDKKVVVKKLNSIQNLGEVNLLCTDKTGTITEGTIRVAGLVDGQGKDSGKLKQLAFWNASLESGYSNPIDDALKKLDVAQDKLPVKTGEVPYDFTRKRLSVAADTGQEKLLISKGAFAQIMDCCSKLEINEEKIEDIGHHKDELEKRYQEYGKSGLRAIAVSYKNLGSETITADLEKDMIFAGFVLMSDPVKQGISETLKELKKLSVDLKIITGDNRNVAEAIAAELGMNNAVVITGKELLSTNAETLPRRARETLIFAEVEPQQKEQIIIALKKSYTVAYMGDGINDVPAIKASDVGISVDNAVDVAREAADFVLMEKNLMVLADGIKEGRRTFANTLKYLFISTGSTFGNMCSVAAASLALPFLPMLPKQILLTNFLTDFPFLTVTTDNVDEERLEKPGKWDIKLIRNYMIFFGVHSSIFDLITFITLYFMMHARESEFQTGWFIESVLSELCILFIIRTRKIFFKSKPGKFLTILSVSALILTISLPYLPLVKETGLIPLPIPVLLSMLAIVAVYILTADILKIWFFKKYQPNDS